MTTTTDLLDPFDALKALPWPDLGLDGEPDQVAAFVRITRNRWREIVEVLKVPTTVLWFAAEGDAQALRELEPAAASVDQLLGEISQETGVRLPPDLLAQAAREASPLIPHLLGVLALAGLLLVWAFVETIKEEYGEDNFKWFMFGSPQEAGAYRALHEDADVRHFLRVFGNAGELGLAEHLAGYEFPVEELEAEVRSNGWLHKTFPELHEWREELVRAAYIVAEYQASDKRENARAQAVARLSPAECCSLLGPRTGRAASPAATRSPTAVSRTRASGSAAMSSASSETPRANAARRWLRKLAPWAPALAALLELVRALLG